MFTGIVQGKAQVMSVQQSQTLRTLTVQFPENALNNLSRGASIAINGACLTVTDFDPEKGTANFDAMQETLAKTNLDRLIEGSSVNFERAARFGDEIGGHQMSGHVHACVKISRIENEQGAVSIYFETPSEFRDYLLPKGYVGLNGCSLTLGEVSDKEFNVYLIPETLAVTTFSDLKQGDEVNLEIDPQTQAIVDTVKRVLEREQK